MKTRQHVLTFIILIFLPVLLFHFQNCAPATKAQASGAGGQQRLIEDLTNNQIQFVMPTAEIQDEAESAGIGGLCNDSMDGTQLNFAVWAEQGSQPLASGNTTCDHGQFTVTLTPMDQYVCGVSQTLVVEASGGGSISSTFMRRCQPTASAPQPAPQGSPAGTTCELDYSPVTVIDTPCELVCYRNNQVVYSQAQDVSQCSPLAAGLAGP